MSAHASTKNLAMQVSMSWPDLDTIYIVKAPKKTNVEKVLGLEEVARLCENTTELVEKQPFTFWSKLYSTVIYLIFL